MSRGEQFAAAVEQAFGAPWVIRRRPDGFEAVLDLRKPDSTSTVPDEFAIDVVVDDAAGTFEMTSGRTRSSTTDVEKKSLGRYQRTVDKRSYSGAHRTWTFKRTPDGLVPTTDDPHNTAAREQEVVAIGESLGLRSAGDTGGVRMNVSTNITPRTKKLFVVLAIAFGVAVLIAIGVTIAIVTTFVGAFVG